MSKYQGFDPPEAHLCGGSIELLYRELKGIFEDFPDFKIDSILIIFGVFAPFLGV